MALPRKRRLKQSEHPAHLVQLHFCCHGLVLPSHQDLHCPDALVVVVVVLVTSVLLLEVPVVLVTVSVVLDMVRVLGSVQEQQGSLVTPSAHRWHSNIPPCDTQAVTCASQGQAGSGDSVGRGVGSGSGSGLGAGSGVGSGSAVGRGVGSGSGPGVGAGAVGTGVGVGTSPDKHWEYHGFETTHSLPASQHVGPVQSIPPHWP